MTSSSLAEVSDTLIGCQRSASGSGPFGEDRKWGYWQVRSGSGDCLFKWSVVKFSSPRFFSFLFLLFFKSSLQLRSAQIFPGLDSPRCVSPWPFCLWTLGKHLGSLTLPAGRASPGLPFHFLPLYRRNSLEWKALLKCSLRCGIRTLESQGVMWRRCWLISLTLAFSVFQFPTFCKLSMGSIWGESYWAH